MHLHDLVIAAPTILRYALPWVKEGVTHLYHKHVVHGGIHYASHRSHKVYGLLHRLPWLVDVAIVTLMVAFAPVVEHAADSIVEHVDHHVESKEHVVTATE
jgi:hypothetical protein